MQSKAHSKFEQERKSSVLDSKTYKKVKTMIKKNIDSIINSTDYFTDLC